MSVQGGLLSVVILVLLAAFCGACLGKGVSSLAIKEDRQGGLMPTLPESIETSRLSEEEPPVLYTADTLWEHLNGGAHQYIQTGFDLLYLAWYQAPEPKQLVMVEIFLMRSSEAADTIFDLETYGIGEKGDLCGQSRTKGNFLFFQRDRYYVKLSANYFDDFTKERLRTIAKGICNVLENRSKSLLSREIFYR